MPNDVLIAIGCRAKIDGDVSGNKYTVSQEALQAKPETRSDWRLCWRMGKVAQNLRIPLARASVLELSRRRYEALTVRALPKNL